MPITQFSERQIISAADNMPQREGRKFICMGPYCYGYGKTAAEAVKNAKKNRVRIYEGKRGWCFILFDADKDTFVDPMGGMTYVPKDDVRPYIEIARFNMPEGKVN